MGLMTLSALWAVMARSLLRSALALACASALLSISMFVLGSPLAAVFELSVCAGLITVVFISTISLTQPMSWHETMQHVHDHLKKYWYLPVILLIGAIVLTTVKVTFNIKVPETNVPADVRDVLWHIRHLDVVGQVLILLVGSFGVSLFFKEKHKK